MHNNFKELYKYRVSISCFRRLSLIYLLNGWKWGPTWQYCLGIKGQTLKDPDKPDKPHPILLTWLIPFDYHPLPKIDVTKCYPSTQISQHFWSHLLDGIMVFSLYKC